MVGCDGSMEVVVVGNGDTGWMRWKLTVGGDLGGGALGVGDELAEGGDFSEESLEG